MAVSEYRVLKVRSGRLNKMNEKFRINDSVDFFPNQHRLESVSQHGTSVSLNVPVSECLLLLVRRPGEVISQQCFVYEVWERKGQLANANTLSQSIHLLRKSLRISGVKENIIKTVPKEGLRFIGTAKLLTDDAHSDHSVNSAEESGNFAVLTIPSVLDDNPVSGAQDIQVGQSSSIGGLKSYLYFIRVVLLLCLFVLFVSSSFTFYKNSTEDIDFFSNYTFIGEVNQCRIYAKKISVLHDEYFHFFKSNEMSCRPGQVVYITMTPEGTRFFLHVCERDINDTASCFTKFYLDKKNER